MAIRDPSSQRPRTPPMMRFAYEEDAIDLRLVADARRDEPGGGQHGHRQIALFRHGPATLALYLFDQGARLPDHLVDGPTIIHVLEGKVLVTTAETQHTLYDNMLLRLSPKVPHDIAADEASRVLMIFCVEGPESHALG